MSTPYVPQALATTNVTYDLPVVNTSSARISVGTCDAVDCFCPAAATAPIWVAVGDASVTAVVPVSGTPGTATPIAPGTSKIIAMQGGRDHVAAIAGSGSSDLIITVLSGTQY